MMETFTLQSDLFFYEKKEEGIIMYGLNKEDKQFYDSIKPGLNALSKTPSDEVIAKILDFSKSL